MLEEVDVYNGFGREGLLAAPTGFGQAGLHERNQIAPWHHPIYRILELSRAFA